MALLVNKDQYIWRMNSALKYKKAIIPFVKGPRVLDYGCGTGVLTDALNRKFANVIGFDQSEEMIEVAQKYAPETTFTTTRPIGFFDTIVLSGVLHEVYSYESERHMILLIQSLLDQLAPGGRLVIREATFRSKSWLEVPVKLNLNAKSFFDKYKENFKWPCPELKLREDGYVVSGPEQDVLEFLNKYTWGMASFSREIQERVYFYALVDWKEMANKNNLKIISYTLIKQKDYYKHLRKLVEVGPIENLDTHHIIVLKKRWQQ